MKKLFKIMLVISMIAAACSCTKDQKDGVAQLNSFSFTATANTEITTDCVAAIDGTTVTVVVPSTVALTSLVPTFELTKNDEMTINGNAVVSGQTACDFSSNNGIKLVVTDALENIKSEYTLTIARNDNKAELVSFGFYAADNTGKITEDYVAEISDKMIVRIPNGGNGVTLVAKIEAGENDVITIDGKPVESSVEVDCTFPIDITVTDAVANVTSMYEVKVGKILKMLWNKIGEYTETGAGDFYGDLVMKIHPTTNVPYFFYNRKEASASTRKPSVIKYENNAFSAVGPLGFNEGNASVLAMEFDNNGVPYVAYIDASATPSGYMTVKKLNGNAWDVVGTAGFGGTDKPSTSAARGIFFDPESNLPRVMWTGNTKTAQYYRSLVLSQFDGSSWNIGTLNGLPTVNGTTGGVLGKPSVVKVGNVLYMAVACNSTGYYIFKYENKSWSKIIDAFNPVGSTQVHSSQIELAADSKGTIYVLACDDSNAAGTWNLQLFRLDEQNKTMTEIANQIPTKFGSYGVNCGLAIDSKDNIYVTYGATRDCDLYPTLGAIDSETKDWGEFKALDDKLNDYSAFVQIQFGKDGTGWLSYIRDSYKVDSGQKDEAGEPIMQTIAPVLVVYKYALEEDILPE